MKKAILATALLGILCLQATVAHAQQDDPVVIEVAGQRIRQSEFMKEFENNVGRQLAAKPGVTEAEKRAALEEYVELYATFRAKEHDALARGFDTADRLRRELNHYRKELAAPYLIDSSMLRRLLDEAYERNHVSLHAAHILIPLRADAYADDTLAALKHILELRRRIVDGGEDFFAVASEVMRSINPQAPVRANEGDLGYFTVFDMVYPFENAAYALKVGEVSQPVRTRYGYHLIKLLDRVEGLYGEVTMAHIWFSSPDSNQRRKDIYEVYDQLNRGVEFSSLALRSDDRTTAENGGLLAHATLGQLPPEYVHMLAGMEEGQHSKPFFTQYGWHIIKLVKREHLPEPADLEGFYKQRMARDQRGDASRKTFAADSRRRYGIVDLTTTPVPQPKARRGRKQPPVRMMASLDELVRIVPDSVYVARWRFRGDETSDTSALVVTPSRRYNALDVARHIYNHQKKGNWQVKEYFVRNQFEDFLDSVSILYADSQLENDYPEFAEVVADYRRGLMIFNYNDQMIWSQAILDSAGFADFFARESLTKRIDNPDDSLFFFHPRARVSILDVASSEALAPEKARKIITKAWKKHLGSSEMKQLLLKKIDRKRYPSDEVVKCDVELVEQTRQELLGADQWQPGVYLHPAGQGYRLLVVEEILPRSLKGMSDARGYYLNAWQNEVERNLNEELRTKYNVKINHDAIRAIRF